MMINYDGCLVFFVDLDDPANTKTTRMLLKKRQKKGKY